ncbi:MAG TPA: hypothetical protein VI032_19060 [Burkholderiaceae bacterium]
MFKPVVFCAAATAAALATSPVRADAPCYDFRDQVPETVYAVNATVPIGIGEVRVRPLRLDGAEVSPGNRFFVVKDQHIAGAAAPEMYGKNVAVQVLPKQAVDTITLKYSHQPGADGARAAMVEVNGVRHEWQGSLHKLDGRLVGSGAHPARFEVRQPNSNGENGWISGELKLSSRDGIRSFTIGAAELRLDDVCFAH